MLGRRLAAVALMALAFSLFWILYHKYDMHWLDWVAYIIPLVMAFSAGQMTMPPTYYLPSELEAQRLAYEHLGDLLDGIEEERKQKAAM